MPAEEVCTSIGIGSLFSEIERKGQTERMADFYDLRPVSEKTHRVLYDEFMVQTEEFYNFFSDPRSGDLQVYFALVYLGKKKLACEESERGRRRER